MENIGLHYVKVTEIYNNDVLALDIVPIIEAEANFYVSNYNIIIIMHGHVTDIVIDIIVGGILNSFEQASGY